ncbi:unnamed protein product [Durusdinium trenchii]|uniref:Uncharacterized protein n=1 Tax=Durusdinium trenchii TaxID=1381693 RepID=A0ABP0M8S4_9DINO
MINAFHSFLRCLLFAGCSQVIDAERARVHQTALEALANDPLPEGRSAMDKSQCPQWSDLRAALQNLGIDAAEAEPHLRERIRWAGCDIVALHLEDLSEKLHGDLSAIENLPDLQELNLSNAKITGDLSNLEKFPKLQQLDLQHTLVSGELSGLRKLTQLHQLTLIKTKITGDLTALTQLTQLKKLVLAETKISGDLVSLRQLYHMRQLNLSHTQVHGDLSGLTKLTQLQVLSLHLTSKVTGDLSSLKHLHQLQVVDLSDTKVFGDLSGLWELIQLQELYLESKMITGDLSSLRQFYQMRQLGLSHTEVHGDLSDLTKLTQLQGLSLHGTKVTGDLSSLKQLHQLQVVDLSESKVFGDLSGLWELTQLQELYLAKSKVYGDLLALEQLKQLEKLNLQSTNSSGELSSLKKLTQLWHLNLANTQVRGGPSSLEDVPLMLLDLTNSKVTFHLSGLEKLAGLFQVHLRNTAVTGDLADLKPLTMLELLDLENTKVAGDLSEVQHLYFLQLLYLTNTAVTGNLSSLEGLRGLSKLDLKSTKVTGNLSSLNQLVELQQLSLRNTTVSGDLSTLISLPRLQEADLSATKVSGRMTVSWRGRAPELRVLNLADSQISFLPAGDDLEDLRRHFYSASDKDFVAKAVLPKLSILDLSRCPLNGNVNDLLAPLGGCGALARIKAEDCGLAGSIPSLILEQVWVGHRFHETWKSPLARSLQVLDVAANRLDFIEAIPSNVFALILAGNPLSFGDGVLHQAVTAGTFLDLENVSIKDHTEPLDLLARGLLQRTDERSSVSTARGYACYAITSKSLQVTPSVFLPQELCACLPGWEGHGTQCTRCPQNTFKNGYDGICQPCPKASNSEEGSTMCHCTYGELLNEQGAPVCGCPMGQALDGGKCLPCHDYHLYCPKVGEELVFAKPLLGFARLKVQDKSAVRCLKPSNTRCNASHASNGSLFPECADGYRGTLCSDCAAHYYASNRLCEPCLSNEMLPELWEIGAASAVVVVLLCLALACVWMGLFQSSESEARQTPRLLVKSVLKEQLRAQAPILLQTIQLWAVLALLARVEQEEGAVRDRFWELPYMEASQFSVASLKGTLNLQCRFDAVAVRMASALLAPLSPLLVLLVCLGIEYFYYGLGINSGLQALTLFYVGGAFGSSRLLRCQRVDGEGASLKEFAFRKNLPHLKCDPDSWHYVDAIGFGAGFCYGVVIPCCLAYLYAKQHLALRPAKLTIAQAADQRDLEVWLVDSKGSSREKMFVKEGVLSRRVVAASAAHIAVLMRGRVQIQLRNGVVTAKLVAGNSSRSIHTETVDALMERCILEEIAESERVLAGSKNLLLKYARCRNLYMEIIQKLVAVALVSTVGSEDGVCVSLAITLAMAATSAMVQPFVQPQVNVTQCCCFLSLALAAVSFDNHWVWLSRAALVLPFLLCALLAIKPDSTQSLAVRLWQQLRDEVEALEKGQVVEVTAETFAFMGSTI